MQAGLAQAQIDALNDYDSSTAFSSRERLALSYAERMTRSDQDVDDVSFQALETEFETPAALTELTAMIAFENFRSKFNHALLVESNGVCQIPK